MKTKSGFEFDIAPEALDDMELVDAIADMDSSPVGISKVLKIMLGNDERRRLYDHVRDDAGRVPASRVAAELEDIFSLLTDELKKSKSSP